MWERYGKDLGPSAKVEANHVPVPKVDDFAIRLAIESSPAVYPIHATEMGLYAVLYLVRKAERCYDLSWRQEALNTSTR